MATTSSDLSMKDILGGSAPRATDGESLYKCERCRDYGYELRLEDRGEKRQVRETGERVPMLTEMTYPCRCEAGIEELVRNSGLRGPRQTLEEFETEAGTSAQRALGVALRIGNEAERGDRGVWWWGATGAGKTHLLRGTLLALARRGQRVRLYSAIRLAETFVERGRGRWEAVDDAVRGAWWIGVDDLGAEASSPAVAEGWLLLLDECLNRGVGFLATSNMDPKKWDAKVMESASLGRLYDRLHQMVDIGEVKIEKSGRATRRRRRGDE